MINYKIAQLLLTPRTKAKTLNEIYISQPDVNKKRLAGKLFVVVELLSTNINGLKIINFLIDTINQTYYQNEKIILRERIPGLKVEHIFEICLSKTNKLFKDFLRSEKIIFDKNKINITIGVIYEEELYFTNTGKNKIFLVFPQKDDETQQKIYKITNIAPKKNQVNENNNKLFNDIISGPIPRGGYILFTNEALPEYLPEQQLLQIVTTLPPTSAVEQIKNNLGQINSYISFLMVIIKSPSLTAVTNNKNQKTKQSTQSSILDLNRTEESTEQLLTPSGLFGLKKWLKKTTNTLSRGEQTASPISENSIILKDKIIVKRKSFSRALSSTIKKTLSLSTVMILRLWEIAKRKKDNKLVITTPTEPENKKNKKWFIFLKKIKSRNKVLVLIAVASIIFFVFSTLRQGKINKQVKKEQNFLELVKEIEQKQDHVEANMLYSNENSARELLQEVDKLIEKLPQETPEEKERYSAFREKFKAQLEKIQRITKISKLQLLMNINDLNSRARAENIIISPSNDKIFVSDPTQKSVYAINIMEKTAATITDLKQDILSLKSPAIADNNNIYYLNEKKLLLFRPDDLDFKNLTIDFNGTSPIAIDTYSSRLYILTSNGGILRYNRNGFSFSSPYAWLPPKSYLKNAIDISIDGHVYVLLQSGEIIKFLRGERQDFKLEKVEPPLEQAKSFFVSPEQKFIYLLDDKLKRLLIYDKTGQFILQYQYPELTSLDDFFVFEKEKKIYLLSGNTVYYFTPPHFK